MAGRTLLLCLLGLASLSAIHASAADKPHQVLDLDYGEVLFHFYQEDYFTAITHLMAASERERLPHHRQEAEMLLGGLQLSYGMLDQAQTRFERLLDTDSDPALRDRVWYYLAKVNYQRGHYRKAQRALEQIGDHGAPALGAERALLAANISMALGENAHAAQSLRGVRAPAGWKEYLEINRGIALLRAGNVAAGRAVLDDLGKQPAAGEELRALRDRANLGLGYQLLRHGDPQGARTYLNRVRMQGPFVQAALLGAGWADAEQGDFQAALTPWMALSKIGGHQPAAQEARLAVPYALAKLGDGEQAAAYYELALDYYEREQKNIDLAIENARSGTLIARLAQADTGTSGGWLHDNPTLRDVPSGRYLVEVLSGNGFQESLKDYRDLGYLAGALNRWLDKIAIYHDMVDMRRLAYERRAPKVRQRLARQEVTELKRRWLQFNTHIDAAREENDPLQLATTQENQHWARLADIQTRLDALPQTSAYAQMREKAAWLKGVLYWQIQADYPIRRWENHKQVRAIEPLLDEASAKQTAITRALAQARAGFSGYDERIRTLHARILALLPRIEAARHASGQHLQRLALEELETRKQRLVSYRSQARYALARSYDQLASTPGEHP